MSGRHWTTNEINTVRRMAAEHCKRAEVADVVGRTVSSLKKKLMRLGVAWFDRGRDRDIQQRVDIMAFVGAGLTMVAIGKRLHLSDSRVSILVKELHKDGLLVRHGTRSRNVKYTVAKPKMGRKPKERQL